jgi:hypothetical protein
MDNKQIDLDNNEESGKGELVLCKDNKENMEHHGLKAHKKNQQNKQDSRSKEK